MKTEAPKHTDAIAIAKEITLALIAKAPPKSGASPTTKGNHAGKIFKAVLKHVTEAMKENGMMENDKGARLFEELKANREKTIREGRTDG